MRCELIEHQLIKDEVMSKNKKIPHLVSIEGVGDFTVQATSRGNACRKVLAKVIASKRLPDQPYSGSDGAFEGVSCSAVGEKCFVMQRPKYIGKRVKNPRYARFPK
jgi:hypothetical protein